MHLGVDALDNRASSVHNDEDYGYVRRSRLGGIHFHLHVFRFRVLPPIQDRKMEKYQSRPPRRRIPVAEKRLPRNTRYVIKFTGFIARITEIYTDNSFCGRFFRLGVDKSSVMRRLRRNNFAGIFASILCAEKRDFDGLTCRACTI